MRTQLAALSVLVAGALLTSAGCTRPDVPAGNGVRPTPETSPDGDDGSTSTRRPSQVARVDYRTQHEGAPVGKHALVYLPAGYDQSDAATRYDIVYLMHGAGMTTDTLLGGPGQTSTLASDLDAMIETRWVRPVIIVTPSFYPDDDASLDLHRAGELDRVFPRELWNDLMPAVEGRFHTYASTPDADGFRASRDHRAFSGFSMGAVTTWYVFLEHLDAFRYFLPMAGECWVIADTGGAVAPERTAARLADAARASGYRKDQYLVVATVGSDDGTRYQMEPQIERMRLHLQAFDPGEDGNLRYLVDPGGGHDLDSMRRQQVAPGLDVLHPPRHVLSGTLGWRRASLPVAEPGLPSLVHPGSRSHDDA